MKGSGPGRFPIAASWPRTRGFHEDDPARHRLHAGSAWAADRIRPVSLRVRLHGAGDQLPEHRGVQGRSRGALRRRESLAQYRGTSFEKSLKTAFEKITQGLKDRIEFRWADVDSAISFHGLGTSISDLELFETVSRAVLDSHELDFEYKKLGSPRYDARWLQPYHLGCIENHWYLFGFDLARQQLRTFALPRMRTVRNTRARFRRPADFSMTKHLGDSFGVFTGKGRYKVRLEFDEFAARLVGERSWHASQRIKPLSAGRIELSLDLGNLEEIERWVLSWGSHVRVLEPAELKRRIRRAAEAILAAS